MALRHPVPDDHLRHIGDITVSFALLESTLQTLVHSLLGAGQRCGQVVTAEVPFRTLRAMAVSLYLERNGEDALYGSLRSLIQRAAEVEEKRNQVTHSVWGAGRDSASITRMKITAKERHGFRFSYENVSSDELQ